MRVTGAGIARMVGGSTIALNVARNTVFQIMGAMTKENHVLWGKFTLARLLITPNIFVLSSFWFIRCGFTGRFASRF
jgi:hypothetical protein